MQLDLITPEKIFFSSAISMVTIPGTLGDFGVLEGHAPFISTIRPGVITIDTEDGTQRRLAVLSGIAEVVQERCIILAENVVDCAGLTSAYVEEKAEQVSDEADVAQTESAKKLVESKRLFVEVLRQQL